jgi:glucose-1-phosphate thymidylyltransferase
VEGGKLKGIILAGGSGSRLYPLTISVSKHILPVFDKPMIYYPLSTLMLAGIRDILIISTPRDLILYKYLFGDGKKIGLNISYQEQIKPEGIAQAFIIGKKFIANDKVALILGDNIFYGYGLDKLLQKSSKFKNGAIVFAHFVKNPERYGVVGFTKNNKIKDIIEKPAKPKSNYAVTGLYFYDNSIVEIAENLSPSKRRELEITDVNNTYLKKGLLKLEILGQETAWFDTGTHETLLKASNFMEALEDRQGLKVACIEEIAYRKKYITKKELIELSKQYSQNQYGKYLLKIAEL